MSSSPHPSPWRAQAPTAQCGMSVCLSVARWVHFTQKGIWVPSPLSSRPAGGCSSSSGIIPCPEGSAANTEPFSQPHTQPGHQSLPNSTNSIPNSSENKVTRLETNPKSATLNFLATSSEPLKLHPGPTSLPVQRPPSAGQHMGTAQGWEAAAPQQTHQHPKKPTSTSSTPQQMDQHPNRPMGTPWARSCASREKVVGKQQLGVIAGN